MTMATPKIVTAEEAVALIPDEATLAIGGSGHMLQVPEGLLTALQDRHKNTSAPHDLTVVHTMGLGDNETGGISRFSGPGLAKKFIGSHYAHNPDIMEMIGRGDYEAFGLPGGALSLLYREIAGHRPGLITKVGLGTYVDPRVDGARLNDKTEGSFTQIVEIAGEEWLFYPSFPIHACFLRATTADEDGNLTMEDEAGLADNLALASAVHNTGGIVIVEVKRLAMRGSLSPRDVVVPGALVDYVTVIPHQRQTAATDYSPYLSGSLRMPMEEIPPLPLNVRKVICRRAAMELKPGNVVNFGFGVATGIPSVLAEEGCAEEMTLSIEQGLVGGIPGTGLDSGTAINAQAFIDEGATFDLYDGGFLDVCCLSAGEVDSRGNVNVSKLGGRAVGPGGFINISQNAKKIVFCGTFTGGGLDVSVEGGEISINKEGRYLKFIDEVGQITYSPAEALREGRQVIYVTERAVFELTADGMVLREIAPGIDIEKDILAHLPWKPLIPAEPVLMDARLFRAEPMGLSL